jgi:predicted transcriptional regulator
MGSDAASAGDRIERTLLVLLLADDPACWRSIEELAQEVGDRTATLRALDRLRAVGLAENDRGLVRASAAARRFDELGL